MRNKELRQLTAGAVLAAMAIVFGALVKYTPGLNVEMPQGGAIFGIYSLPIVLAGMILGYKYGILTGLSYGVVSWLMDGYFIHWGSIFFDYLIPFSLMGLSGAIFYKGLNDWKKIVIAFLIAGILRWISSGLSGVMFFGEYAGEYNPWFYSFILYNAPYVFSSVAISLVLALLLRNTLLNLAEEVSLY